MTEHDIKELKRQFDDAYSREVAARIKVNEARQRYDDARIANADAEFANRGIEKGQKVIGKRQRHDDVTGIFMGHEIKWNDVKPIIRKVTKSGEAHKTAEAIGAWVVQHWEPVND